MLAETQRKTALADGTELPTAPTSSQAFVDLLLTRHPLNPDRERCISFLTTGWNSDSGCASTRPLSGPSETASQQPWRAAGRGIGASSLKGNGGTSSKGAGAASSARTSSSEGGNKGNRPKPGGSSTSHGATSFVPKAALGMPKSKVKPSGGLSGAAPTQATKPPTPAPGGNAWRSPSASASAAKSGAGLAHGDGRKSASDLGTSGKRTGAVSRGDSPSVAPTPPAGPTVAPASAGPAQGSGGGDAAPCIGGTRAPAPAPAWGAGPHAGAPPSRPPPSSTGSSKPPMGGAAASAGSSTQEPARNRNTHLRCATATATNLP